MRGRPPTRPRAGPFPGPAPLLLAVPLIGSFLVLRDRGDGSSAHQLVHQFREPIPGVSARASLKWSAATDDWPLRYASHPIKVSRGAR